MFLRALLAFILLPGIFAFLLPPLIGIYDPWGKGVMPVGMVIMAVGLFLLMWCVRDFYVSGRGTLAPWYPPEHLVVVGLYRYVRNPMYIAVLILVTGWSIYLLSPIVACYTLVLAIRFHIRVITREEPWLAAQFGSEWIAYAAEVSRWRPRFVPWGRPSKS
jgi:protein-S-isoprenylcysteine O-methyltransferase Ste14